MSAVERTMAELMDGYGADAAGRPSGATMRELTEGERCRPCQHGNHSGTNGTAGCEGGSCGCPCRGGVVGLADLTPAQRVATMAEARDWLDDCFGSEVVGIDEATVVWGIDRHYEGGWPAFLEAVQP